MSENLKVVDSGWGFSETRVGMEKRSRGNAPELGFTKGPDADKVETADHDEPERNPDGDVDSGGAGPVIENERRGDNFGRNGNRPGVPARGTHQLAVTADLFLVGTGRSIPVVLRV